MKNEIIEVYLDDEDGTTITYDVDEWWSYEAKVFTNALMLVIRRKDGNWIGAYNMEKIIGFSVLVKN